MCTLNFSMRFKCCKTIYIHAYIHTYIHIYIYIYIYIYAGAGADRRFHLTAEFDDQHIGSIMGRNCERIDVVKSRLKHVDISVSMHVYACMYVYVRARICTCMGRNCECIDVVKSRLKHVEIYRLVCMCMHACMYVYVRAWVEIVNVLTW